MSNSFRMNNVFTSDIPVRVISLGKVHYDGAQCLFCFFMENCDGCLPHLLRGPMEFRPRCLQSVANPFSVLLCVISIYADWSVSPPLASYFSLNLLRINGIHCIKEAVKLYISADTSSQSTCCSMDRTE